MNIKRIQEIIELMNSNDLSEVDIEEEGAKIRIVRKGQGSAAHEILQAPVAQAVPPQPQTAAEKTALEAKKLLEIKSPMVGTFYRSPSPDADPYVKVGDMIHKGDVLCIVEAMKLMNEVKSEQEGKLVNILVENAEPVEFGQTMFLIEPV